MSEEKFCKSCNSTKPIVDFQRRRLQEVWENVSCNLCVRAFNRKCKAEWLAQREQRKLNKLNYDYRDATLKKKYGITGKQYDQMLKQQGGVCKICQQKCSTKRKLAVDHDHGSGAVRGLLCFQCNSAIGKLKDSVTLLRRAADYLEQSGTVDITSSKSLQTLGGL